MIHDAICFGLPVFVAYVIPLFLFAARGRKGWTKMTSDGKLIVGLPLHMRIGLAMHFFGMALAGPLVLTLLLSDSRDALNGWDSAGIGAMIVMGILVVLSWAGLWAIARACPLMVTTIDLERRVYETRARRPAPDIKRTGSLEEFAGVYMDERRMRVYLVEKDWVKGGGKRRIFLGAPAAGLRTNRTQRVRAYGFAVEMSEILGLSIVRNPTNIVTRTAKVRQKPI